MSSNPKTSAWYSTPKTARKRKTCNLTLSDEALEKLERLAETRGKSRARVVEELILRAKDL